MSRQDVEARTEELFRGGLHCAEAVLQAVLESEAGETGAGSISPRVATAFGGGIGRSKLGMCGALSGGLMALGILRGRDSGRQPWDEVAELADGLFRRFKEEYGCTRCPAVLEKLGPQDKMDKCIRLAGRTAGMVAQALAGALSGETDTRPVQACGCGCAELHSPATPRPAPAAPGGCGCK